MAQYSRQPASQSEPDADAGINTVDDNTGWTRGDLGIGYPASGGQLNHSMISWDMTSMNAAAIMTSAYISLYLYSNNANGSATNYGHRLKRNWWSSTTKWSKYDGTNNWQTAGGTGANDIDTTASVSCSVAQNPSQYTEHQHNFDAYGLAELHKMFDGTYTNYGWLFKHATEDAGNANQHFWCSMEYATGGSAYHPKLVINYDIPSAPGIMIVGLFSLGQEARHVRWSRKMKKILNPWDVPDWAPELKPI